MKVGKLTWISGITLATAVAIATATTPCGWPKAPVIDPGGTCINPWFGARYCTDPSLTTDGGCSGSNNPKKCASVAGAKTMPRWIPRDPDDCAAGCIQSGQVKTINYTEGRQLDEDCITIVPPDNTN